MGKKIVFFLSLVLLVAGGGDCGKKKEEPQKVDLWERHMAPAEDRAEDLLIFGVSGGESSKGLYRKHTPKWPR